MDVIRVGIGAFLKLLPDRVDGVRLRHALEVRHDSFRDDAFYAMATVANAAIIRADHERYPLIEADIADFTYARLMHPVEAEAAGYAPDALNRWAATARDWAKTGDTFVYMISGAKIRAPVTAHALIARLG